MHLKSFIVLSIFQFLVAAKGIQTAQLLCYVCEDCDKITTKTPLVQCNSGYFTDDITTTIATTIESSTSTTTPSTTTEELTTTEAPTTTTTTTTTTEPTTTTQITTTEEKVSTDSTIPTPATVGPANTTTELPTPPAPDNETVSRNSTNSTAPDSNVRKSRSVASAVDYTYHCYLTQNKVNGTTITNRGCARVPAAVGVCEDLQSANNVTQYTKCFPCSNSRCNSSTALTVSLTALIFGVLAVFLRRN